MTILDIRRIGDPVLRRRATEVTDFDAELRRLVADLTATMLDAPGVGLAAPQIGVGLRVFTYHVDGVLGHVVNPVLTLEGEREETEEGCLSIPEHYAEVTRPAHVRMRWTGLDGRAQAAEFEGLWATCVQHELDHLNGKLFIDHIGPMRRQMITRKMEKLKRERARA